MFSVRVRFSQWSLQLLIKENVQPSKANYIGGIVYHKTDEESLE
jgi:hypothetical protein